jgi:Zn-dependent peptidase ImmA (M78 family)
MWLDNESQEIVESFWKLVGEKESFPRMLERSISLALPVALVKLPQLDLHIIENWLLRRSVKYSFDCNNRIIRGCLVAFNGKGIVFVDGTDTSSELRFTVAHEIAHFLIDYWQARNKASTKYGSSILEVFDGLREPSVDERVYSIIDGTATGLYTNLMERSPHGENSNTWHVENRADKVALALLAPSDAVFRKIEITGKTFLERRNEVVSILNSYFGLPDYVALSYGTDLLKSIGKGPSWVESLRLAS